MKVTWLSQAGLLFENDKIKILVDPYLSDSIGEVEPKKKRRMPIDESLFDLKPDVILITHDHRDHLDLATLDHYLKGDGSVTVMSGECAFKKLLAYGGDHNYVLLAPHSVWSQQGVTFYSVHAEHSDRTAVGFIIDDGEETFYVSGDTLYNYDVIDDVLDLVEDGVDYAFLPINGRGNNMNAKDAADFAYEIDAKHAIPTHYGLIDEIDPRDFDFDDRVILTPYEPYEL
jgi:L-ascorbate metabolism protein UlaG (beta-lactamase superfamily)